MSDIGTFYVIKVFERDNDKTDCIYFETECRMEDRARAIYELLDEVLPEHLELSARVEHRNCKFQFLAARDNTKIPFEDRHGRPKGFG